MLEPGHLQQSLPESLCYHLIFFFFQILEQVPLRRICDLPPSIVAPELVHALQVCWVHAFGMPPQDVSIYVSDREVQKHVNRTHLSGSLNHLPVQVQPIRIKQAQPATILFPADIRKNLLQQNAVELEGD